MTAVLDYGKEAERYDASRGGEARAAAAAGAVLGFLPEGTRRLLDVACGTGIVTRRLAAADGLSVTGVDLTPAMARRAAARLPGSVLLADARRLPFRDGAFDAVSSVWLLHLAATPGDVRTLVGECARVLKRGRYMAIIVSDFRDKSKYIMFHADLARALEAYGMEMRGLKVLYQRHKKVFPYGYPYSYVPNIHNQYILILQKPK